MKSIQDNNMEQFIKDIKRDLIFQFILSIKHMELSAKKAQNISKAFLDCLPPESKEELLGKLQALGKDNRVVMDVFIKYANLYGEEKKCEAVKIASRHIRDCEIEEAIEIIKKGEQVWQKM